MAYALQAKTRWSRIVQLYSTAEECVEHAAPGCTICEVPDQYRPNLGQEETERLLQYIDSLPTEQVIAV